LSARGTRSIENQDRARTTLLALFDEALRAVSPAAVMPASTPLAVEGRTVVIAIGKAAGEMMRVAQQRAERPLEGLVVTRHGHVPAEIRKMRDVEIVEAGHPLPDEHSVLGARRALELAHGLKAGDRLLVLLSGGGSALAAAPAAGMTLEDKRRVTEALLRSGASIDEFNCVRKHLSMIKGGRLAVAAIPAEIETWIISDVPGDDPSLVASGPTAPDRTTLAEARAILDRYGIRPSASITRALADPANETPPPDSPALVRARVRLLAGSGTTLAAAARMMEAGGRTVTNLGHDLQEEARSLGAAHADLARALSAAGLRAVILSGGECRVTVANPDGRGGRNLEYLLGLAIALDGAGGIAAIACDTDGIDGSSDAAGALIFPDTLDRARRLGLDPSAHLATHRSHAFFEALGDLVTTGPTLTNVGDFRAIVIDQRDDG
jgi:glycerate 2-kinase